MKKYLSPLTDLFAVVILCVSFLVGCLVFGV